LIAHGAILGAHARLSAEATRRPIQIFTLINLVEDSSATLKAFVKSVVKQPGVVEAYYLAGEADVVLVIRAQSMESYAAFAEKHFNGNRTVKRFQTLTVLKTLS
jgi:Lrp/AsnC family leucine-responsive transcriptional regulator